MILVGLENVNGEGVEVLVEVGNSIVGVVEEGEKVEGFLRTPTRKCGRVVWRV